MRMSIMGAHEAEMSKLRMQLKNFGLNPAVTGTNANGSMTGTSATGMQDSGSSANVINERLNAELKEQQEKVFAEQKETTELRAQLEANLQHLTKLVITATNVAKTNQYPSNSTSRYSDSGALHNGHGCTKKKVRQTWGPREIQCHFGQSLSSKSFRTYSNTSNFSASSFMDETEQLRNALESMEEELLEVNGLLEGERQSRMEAETRAMQLDSYVGLLTDGIGMEDKSSEELESLESMFLQGLQRVVEARHLQTINDQRDLYEQKLAEMESMYKSKIEKLKTEHTECQDSFQKEKASLKIV